MIIKIAIINSYFSSFTTYEAKGWCVKSMLLIYNTAVNCRLMVIYGIKW